MARLQEIPAEFADDDTIYESFGEYCREIGVEPYPAQDEAFLTILAGDNTIMATPTGSGKSLVALFALYQSFTRGIRSYYTAPLKALVSEKFFSLIDAFGAENVGMITGDSTVNPEAPVICATAEILANQALREGGMLDAGMVVMDEFHYVADPSRGWAWQVPLLEMPQTQFVLMSATLGDTTDIRRTMTETTGRDSSVVTSATRPVPLDYEYSTETLSDTLRGLVRNDKSPVYVVSYSQNGAIDLATNLLSVDLASKEQKAAIAAAIKGFTFGKGFGTSLRKLLLHGVGVHHAGMLPKYRRLIEQLALKGLLLVISGTDTLGVGINVPIRSVLLTGLTKFDGRKMRRLSVREFQQLAGRAGRAGFDTRGYVIAQAPEHVIDNLKAEAKAANDDKKKKKKVKKKAAPVGFVGWSEETFAKLIEGESETLRPRMKIDHSTILNLVARPGSDVSTISDFIDKTHETRERRLDLKLTAISIGRSLIDAGLIEVRGSELIATQDLGPQFALNQPLAPFVLAALELLDEDDDTYALDVVSIVEATTSVGFQILKGQLDRNKGETLAELKAEGVEYAERMAILDEIESPAPLAEMLDPAFDHFVETHPWLHRGGFEPKSIVRDMIEQAMGFTQFVGYYSLARAEGSLLRYLTDVYRALLHNVPAENRTEELETIIEWCGETIARTDSSLLDEWRTLQGLDPTEAYDDLPALDRRFSENTKVFTAEIRNALFHRVLLAERANYTELGRLDAESGFDSRAWEDAIEDFYDEYGELIVDQKARGREYIHISPGSDTWSVRQILADPDDNRDWAIDAAVDVAASDESGDIVLRILSVGEIGR